MAAKRRFELVEGSSSKFWEAWVEGSDLQVRYGRIGTEGKTLPKTFASPAEANAELEKLAREKARKGYAEVGAKATPATTPKPGKKAGAESTSRNWKPRFEALVAGLRANKSLKVTAAKIPAPATDAQIAAAEKSLGRAIDADVAAFYRELNGFDLEWERKDDDEIKGRIHLLPIQKVFADWDGIIWFSEMASKPGEETFEQVVPFDFFVPEACAAFRKDESPLRVHYHYCGEEIAPTRYAFTDYLERLLASRGYWYWVQTLTDATAGSTEAERFLENAHELFPDVALDLFRPAGATLTKNEKNAKGGAPTLADRLLAAKEVTRSLVGSIQDAGAAGLSTLRDLLGHPKATARLRALEIVRSLEKKAASLAPEVLTAPVGIPVIDIHVDRSTFPAALLPAGRAFASLAPKKDFAKFAESFRQMLEKQTSVLPFHVFCDALGGTVADPSGHFYDVAFTALQGENVGERAVASNVLGNIEKAAVAYAALTTGFEKSKGKERARRIRGLGSVYVDSDLLEEQAKYITSSLSDPDPEVHAACISCLYDASLLEKNLPLLKKAMTHASEKVRWAALEQIALMPAGKSWTASHDLLREISKNEKQIAPIRTAADAYIKASPCSRKGCCR